MSEIGIVTSSFSPILGSLPRIAVTWVSVVLLGFTHKGTTIADSFPAPLVIGQYFADKVAAVAPEIIPMPNLYPALFRCIEFLSNVFIVSFLLIIVLAPVFPCIVVTKSLWGVSRDRGTVFLAPSKL